MFRKVSLLVALTLLALPVLADDSSVGSTAAGQAVADALREFANSDVALVPAGLLKDPDKKDDAASALAFGNDGIVLVKVTGATLRAALERSIAAFPQSSVGFLQVSGLEATFRKGAPANARLVAVNVGGAKLEDARSYTVAMPMSLQQGQLGYANLWENIKASPFPKATMASVVKGRHVGSSAARWSPLG